MVIHYSCNFSTVLVLVRNLDGGEPYNDDEPKMSAGPPYLKPSVAAYIMALRAGGEPLSVDRNDSGTLGSWYRRVRRWEASALMDVGIW